MAGNTYNAASAVLQAAGVRPHPARIRIFRCLKEHGPRTVQWFMGYYNVAYRSTLNALHRLEDAGLVVSYPEDLDGRSRAGATRPRMIWQTRS